MTVTVPVPADPTILELYKLAVEMADRVSARRGTANAFFLTIQTTFVAVLVVTLPTVQHTPKWATIVAVGAGLLLSSCWWLQLKSYRDLNRAKFEVIMNVEKSLPWAVFTQEWNSLKTDPVKRWRPRYAELGTIERTVPGIFAALYLLLLVGKLLS